MPLLNKTRAAMPKNKLPKLLKQKLHPKELKKQLKK
jgi:hypothetical protein